jgi:hypothetical protein
MKCTAVKISILTAALIAFASGNAFAQHDRHSDAGATQAQATPQTTPSQANAPAPAKGMMGGSNGPMKGDMKAGDAKSADMKSGEMGMMAKMQDREKQTSDLMAKLTSSMDAIDNEKNPTALKQKLAEHRALLEQLQKQTSEPKCELMEKMSSMMGKDGQAAAK